MDVQEVDITLPENSKWFDVYEYEIPVGHLNGKQIFKNKISEGHLRELLKKNFLSGA